MRVRMGVDVYGWVSARIGSRAAACVMPFVYAAMVVAIGWCLLEPSDGFDYLLR